MISCRKLGKRFCSIYLWLTRVLRWRDADPHSRTFPEWPVCRPDYDKHFGRIFQHLKEHLLPSQRESIAWKKLSLGICNISFQKICCESVSVYLFSGYVVEDLEMVCRITGLVDWNNLLLRNFSLEPSFHFNNISFSTLTCICCCREAEVDWLLSLW